MELLALTAFHGGEYATQKLRGSGLNPRYWDDIYLNDSGTIVTWSVGDDNLSVLLELNLRFGGVDYILLFEGREITRMEKRAGDPTDLTKLRNIARAIYKSVRRELDRSEERELKFATRARERGGEHYLIAKASGLPEVEVTVEMEMRDWSDEISFPEVSLYVGSLSPKRFASATLTRMSLSEDSIAKAAGYFANLVLKRQDEIDRSTVLSDLITLLGEEGPEAYRSKRRFAKTKVKGKKLEVLWVDPDILLRAYSRGYLSRFLPYWAESSYKNTLSVLVARGKTHSKVLLALPDEELAHDLRELLIYADPEVRFRVLEELNEISPQLPEEDRSRLARSIEPLINEIDTLTYGTALPLLNILGVDTTETSARRLLSGAL